MTLCSCSHGCPAAPVRQDHIRGWPLRHRLGYNADLTGRHSGQRSELFAGRFYNNVCGPIIRDFDGFSRWVGGPALAWVGNVGVTVCKAGMHGQGRAFDLTRVQMRGHAVDCNTSWRADRSIAIRRRYLAVVATCRAHVGTVLTTWYNAAHRNHIHFDNGVPFTRIRTNMRSDTTLVQASSNLLNGAGIRVDGVWGPRTEQAYNNLRRQLGLGSLNPKTNTRHARRFIVHIAVLGFANRPA